MGNADFYGIERESLAETAKKCRAMGLVKVVAQYSGGNDEGGVDTCTGYKADDTAVDLSGYWNRGYTMDPDTKRLVPLGRAESPPELPFAADVFAALEYPVVDRWGSFAGEFFASGEVVFDVQAERMIMDGHESGPDIVTHAEW